MSEDLRRIGEPFRFDGEFVRAGAYGSGHIHETFLAEYQIGGRPRRYILQRLNTRIFADTAALCDNLQRVTAHLRAKLAKRNLPDLDRRCLELIETRAGSTLHLDRGGAPWRAFRYIEGTRSRDDVEGAAQAREAARAFGCFAADLADLPKPPLAATIPDFHDLPKRLERLREADRADPFGRASAVTTEVARALRGCERLARTLDEESAADLPIRVMHNDCKLNNLLLDSSTGEGLCVIDLDTVMDGSVLCDFGELVRSGASRAAEDEPNLAAIHFDGELFEALAEGYLAGTRGMLAPQELRALPLAGPALTLENAVRFLTDHLAGDVYFRIHRPGHNLDRARAQLHLAEQMLQGLDASRRTVERLALRTSL